MRCEGPNRKSISLQAFSKIFFSKIEKQLFPMQNKLINGIFHALSYFLFSSLSLILVPLLRPRRSTLPLSPSLLMLE